VARTNELARLRRVCPCGWAAGSSREKVDYKQFVLNSNFRAL
jgi:hypothetical protein